VCLSPPLSEFPLEFCNGGTAEKIVMSLRDGGNSIVFDDMCNCAFVSIQYQVVTDRQTDRRTDGHTDGFAITISLTRAIKTGHAFIYSQILKVLLHYGQNY